MRKFTAILVFGMLSVSAYASGEMATSQKLGLVSFAVMFCVSVVFVSISIYNYKKPSKWLSLINGLSLTLLALAYIGILAMGLASSIYLNIVVSVICLIQLLFFIRFKTQ